MLRLWPLLLLLGCRQDPLGSGFFTAEGALTSSGGGLGSWSIQPQACTRDPFLGSMEGLPFRDPDQSRMTLLWEDFSLSKPRPDLYRRFGPDVPRRLEIASGPQGFTAILRTMKLRRGVRLDHSNCRVFSLATRETPPAEPHGRPLLAGELRLDCLVQKIQQDQDLREDEPSTPALLPSSHVTADIRFRNCGF